MTNSNKRWARGLLFCFLLMFFWETGGLLKAQEQLPDSLYRALRSAPQDTTKIKILNDISRTFMMTGNYDSSLLYSGRALLLAEKLQTVKQPLVALACKKGIAYAYNNMGNVQTYKGEFATAMESHRSALAIRESINDTRGMAASHNNIANIFSDEGNYPKALKHYLISLSYREQNKDKLGMSIAYNNLATVYFQQGNFTMSLTNNLKALNLSREINDKEGMAYSYNNIGGDFFHQRNFIEAIKNYQAGLDLMKEIGDQRGISSCYSNIANGYSNLGAVNADKNAAAEQLRLSLEYHFKALNIRKQTNDKIDVANSLAHIGGLYVQTRQFKDAERYCLEALGMAKEMNIPEVIKNCHRTLSETYELTGREKQSLAHYKMFVATRDSMVNEESTKKTVRLQMNYDFEKREAAVRAEQEKKDVIAREHAQKRIWSFGAFWEFCY